MQRELLRLQRMRIMMNTAAQRPIFSRIIRIIIV